MHYGGLSYGNWMLTAEIIYFQVTNTMVRSKLNVLLIAALVVAILGKMAFVSKPNRLCIY